LDTSLGEFEGWRLFCHINEPSNTTKDAIASLKDPCI
jgi:hypothetical protein